MKLSIMISMKKVCMYHINQIKKMFKFLKPRGTDDSMIFVYVGRPIWPTELQNV